MRIFIGLALTALWLGATAFYLYRFVGIENLVLLMPTELAEIVIGIALPAVFLWLIIGSLQQAAALRRNNAALARLTESQTAALTMNDFHARRAAFLGLAATLDRELERLAREIVALLSEAKGKDGTGARHQPDDGENGYRAILAAAADAGNPLKTLVADSPKGNRLLERYCETFEMLLAESTSCDDEGRLRQLYESAAMGEVYAVFRRRLEREPA
ncbi:MAG: hypothetical protein ACE5H8_13260 [Alphaproteobacteria bacterium]